MNPTAEIEYWFRKEQEQKKLKAERNRKQMEMLDATTRTKSVSSTIPDMRDAYRQVRKSNASIPQSVISATTTRTYK